MSNKMQFFKNFMRNSSFSVKVEPKLSEVSIIGKDLICPLSLTATELKSVLWTALDLRHVLINKISQQPLMKKPRVTLVMDNANAYIQLPCQLGANMVGATINVIIDKAWKKHVPFLCDYGRFLSMNSDLIICGVGEQKNINLIKEEATVPVLGVSSSEFDNITALTHVMTIYEHYMRLKYLTVAWIGKPTALLNSYTLFLPQFKMNLKYFLAEGTCNKYATEAEQLSEQCSEIKEIYNLKETLRCANVISITQHENCDCQITLDIINEEAAENWTFLHNLPRLGTEVKCDVFNHTNSLVWKSIENMQFVYAALIIRLLSCYSHISHEPFFDSDEFIKK